MGKDCLIHVQFLNLRYKQCLCWIKDYVIPQQGGERSKEAELAEEQYRAAVPLLPARTDASMREYWQFYLMSVSIIILFGALVAPTLEVKMGLGGKYFR